MKGQNLHKKVEVKLMAFKVSLQKQSTDLKLDLQLARLNPETQMRKTNYK